ncbi:Lysophospholipase L1 [Lachnospiraceae bacterium XBB2008]|nr:Lysophospholipase L1 [Lachnospiraceae bacterium XBB2008]
MKLVSFMGDSISTYEGYNPPGYAVFYEKEMQDKNGLLSVDDTWWSIVLKSIGGTLCVNDSYSGSRVSGNSFPAGWSDERILNLRKDERYVPEIIIIYLGYNDFGYGVKIRKKGLYNPFAMDTRFFWDAYNMMLIKIKKQYPKATIICGTLLRTTIMDRTDWIFPEEFGGISFDEYNNVIRRVCKRNKVRLADIAINGDRCETIDGSHPTKNGHATLADRWIEHIGEYKEKEEDGRAVLLLPDNLLTNEEERLSSFMLVDKSDYMKNWQCYISHEITIGRASDNNICFPQTGYDNYIHGHHCVIRRERDQFYIIDPDLKKSRNHSKVNGIELVPEIPVIIKTGDEVTIGKHTFWVSIN